MTRIRLRACGQAASGTGLAVLLLAAAGCAPQPTLSTGEMRALAMRYVTSAATFRENPVLRAQAIETLQDIEGAAASHWFREAIDDLHPGVRFAACMAIGSVRYKDAEPQLRARLSDPDASVRVSAMYALRRLGDSGFVAEWADVARSNTDPTVRRNAVMALGRLAEPEAVALLRRMREDEDVGVRLQALESMGLLGNHDAVKQLISFANGAYGDKQAFALIALGRIGDPTCLETLRYCLFKAPHLESKLAAARALGMMGHKDGYDVAMAALAWNRPDPKIEDDPPENQIMRVHSMAAFALGAIGNADALEPLRKMMDEGKDPRIQLAAASAMLHILHKNDAATRQKSSETASPFQDPAFSGSKKLSPG